MKDLMIDKFLSVRDRDALRQSLEKGDKKAIVKVFDEIDKLTDAIKEYESAIQEIINIVREVRSIITEDTSFHHYNNKK